MLRPSLRISLATTLFLVAILGAGTGMAMRWRNEWKRTELHRYSEAELKRLQSESLDARENRLRAWADRMDTLSCFTPQEKVAWGKRIQTEYEKVELEIEEAHRKYWEYRRSCN